MYCDDVGFLEKGINIHIISYILKDNQFEVCLRGKQNLNAILSYNHILNKFYNHILIGSL